MSVIHFTTRSKDVFPYWTKAPEIGLRRIMTLIALAPKTGLTGSKTPVVRDRNGRVIDGLVVDSSDAKEFVERLTKYDFSTDWQEKMHHQCKADLFVGKLVGCRAPDS